MDTRTRIDEFLTLESAMQRLLDQLRQLRDETESYSTARESLAATSDGVRALMEQLSAVASEVQDVARAIREIGTPELLARHDALQGQFADLVGKLDTLTNHSTSSLQAIEQNHTGTIQALSEGKAISERLNQALENLTSTVSVGVETLRQDVSRQAGVIVQSLGTLETEVNRLQVRIRETETGLQKKVRNLQVVMIVLTVIAVAIVSAVLLLA